MSSGAPEGRLCRGRRRIHEPEFQRSKERFALMQGGPPDEEKAIAYEYAAYKHKHSGLSKIGKLVPDIETRKRIATVVGDFQESCPD